MKDFVTMLAMDRTEDSSHEELEDDPVNVSSCRPGRADAVFVKKEDAVFNGKKKIDSSQSLNYGYGGRRKLKDPSYFGEDKQISCSNQEHDQKIIPRGEPRGHHSSASFSLSNQRIPGAFQGHSNYRQKATGQASRINGYFETNGKYRSHDNEEAIDDQTRGPRSYRMDNPSAPSSLKGNLGRLIHIDQYNRSDFQIEYEFAKFFMIKSYSEDDIHKSIKYSVWSSTTYGNNRLESAYWNAAQMAKEKSSNCPIFLFFSVNGSGQFLGLAEMDGPVDFGKDLNFWKDEKWSGFFPVKWRIVKDIPNKHFQSIRLENNDNRVVTYSRDTQEIGIPHGLKMLSIFRSYGARTSMLDDFEFYERKEKAMRITRAKRSSASHKEFERGNRDPSMMKLEEGVKKMSVSQKALRPSVLT